MDSLGSSSRVHRLVCDAATGLREVCECLSAGPLSRQGELVLLERLEIIASAVVEALRVATLHAADGEQLRDHPPGSA